MPITDGKMQVWEIKRPQSTWLGSPGLIALAISINNSSMSTLCPRVHANRGPSWVLFLQRDAVSTSKVLTCNALQTSLTDRPRLLHGTRPQPADEISSRPPRPFPLNHPTSPRRRYWRCTIDSRRADYESFTLLVAILCRNCSTPPGSASGKVLTLRNNSPDMLAGQAW